MWNTIERLDDEAERVAKFIYSKDNAVAESVLYRYPTYEERTVICCSTQSGCPIGCRFCGAGDYFVRSLTVEEIVSQVEYSIEQSGTAAADMQKLQIMFMSMGEPLLNLRNLIPAMHILYTKYPHASLLISTSAPDIGDDGWEALYAAATQIPTIGLQFSVHESTDDARNVLIPFKNKLSLTQMASEGAKFLMMTGRHPFFNYCAHGGNSSSSDADRLWFTFSPLIFKATVSVICERTDGMAASNEHQRNLAVMFAERLVKRSYDVRVFDPAGQDTIGGGCGQLHYVQKWFQENTDKVKPSVGHGKDVVHAPVKD